MSLPVTRPLPQLLLPVVLLASAACTPPGRDAPTDVGPTPALPPRSPVQSLANASAADYGHNRWGLIEASTLQAFATNWATVDSAAPNASANGRPAHLAADARLVVLQLNKAGRAPGEDYVPSAPASNVFVYELDAFRFNETRDTGRTWIAPRSVLTNGSIS